MSIPTVAYFADLPTAVPPNIDSQYLVTNGSGTGPGVRTPSGLYQRINTTGVLSIDWQYWGNTDPYGSVTLASLGAQAAITFGTGVLTALGVNIGSAGAPVLFNGALGTPASGALTNCTFPTLNQSTTGSAAKWTTARNLAGNSVDGSTNVAFANNFVVQGTVDAGLSAAQFLGALGTGIVRNTTTTGVLSIAVAGDFPTLNQNTSGTAAGLSATLVVGSGGTGATSLGSSLTNAGSVLNTIQDIRTTATPTHAGLTLTNLAALTTPAESWVGPSSTAGVYFKGGNVGIGTTTPAKVLDVNGTFRAGVAGINASTFECDPSSGNCDIGGSSGAGSGPSSDTRLTILGATTDSTKYLIVGKNSSTTNQFWFRNDGTFYNSGNVGIGTTTPRSKLSVVGLPTSASGLTSGDIWCDTTGGLNILKIV